MRNKTLKIAEELHDLLKLKALQERKTLQEVTEEILQDAFKPEDQRTGQGTEKDSQPGGNQETT